MEQRPFRGTSGPGSLPRFDRRHAPRSGSCRETRSAKGGVANDPRSNQTPTVYLRRGDQLTEIIEGQDTSAQSEERRGLVLLERDHVGVALAKERGDPDHLRWMAQHETHLVE